jgi:hypothetical protein
VRRMAFVTKVCWQAFFYYRELPGRDLGVIQVSFLAQVLSLRALSSKRNFHSFLNSVPFYWKETTW